MATIHLLPPELVAEIFDYSVTSIIDDRADSSRYHDACSLALVCRWFRDPAQRAMFGTVGLYQQSQALAWLGSPGRERYLTRHLSLGGVHKSLAEEVLAACPGLASFASLVYDRGGHDACLGDQLISTST